MRGREKKKLINYLGSFLFSPSLVFIATLGGRGDLVGAIFYVLCGSQVLVRGSDIRPFLSRTYLSFCVRFLRFVSFDGVCTFSSSEIIGRSVLWRRSGFWIRFLFSFFLLPLFSCRYLVEQGGGR